MGGGGGRGGRTGREGWWLEGGREWEWREGRPGREVRGAGEAAALGGWVSRRPCQCSLVAVVDRSLQTAGRRPLIDRSWGVRGDRIKSVTRQWPDPTLPGETGQEPRTKADKSQRSHMP